ncbi:hypothetical protein D3C73_1101940 [compost metagenome]
MSGIQFKTPMVIRATSKRSCSSSGRWWMSASMNVGAWGERLASSRAWSRNAADWSTPTTRLAPSAKSERLSRPLLQPSCTTALPATPTCSSTLRKVSSRQEKSASVTWFNSASHSGLSLWCRAESFQASRLLAMADWFDGISIARSRLWQLLVRPESRSALSISPSAVCWILVKRRHPRVAAIVNGLGEMRENRIRRCSHETHRTDVVARPLPDPQRPRGRQPDADVRVQQRVQLLRR